MAMDTLVPVTDDRLEGTGRFLRRRAFDAPRAVSSRAGERTLDHRQTSLVVADLSRDPESRR
jgi:molybdopterin biosynthesis enzyme MoaB